jgi:hypothetical protein
MSDYHYSFLEIMNRNPHPYIFSKKVFGKLKSRRDVKLLFLSFGHSKSVTVVGALRSQSGQQCGKCGLISFEDV